MGGRRGTALGSPQQSIFPPLLKHAMHRSQVTPDGRITVGSYSSGSITWINVTIAQPSSSPDGGRGGNGSAAATSDASLGQSSRRAMRQLGAAGGGGGPPMRLAGGPPTGPGGSGGPPFIQGSGGPPFIQGSGGPPFIQGSGGPPFIQGSGGPPGGASASPAGGLIQSKGCPAQGTFRSSATRMVPPAGELRG